MSGGLPVPFNCPYCGLRMAHMLSEENWHFFQCEACGPISLPPDGRIRRSNATDYPVLKLEDRKRET